MLHKDIQSLNYEFGAGDSYGAGGDNRIWDIYTDVEIWRGAVARIDTDGALDVVGNEGKVNTGMSDDPEGYVVEADPIAAWEIAPRLIDNSGASINARYNPKSATGADYAHPLDRAIKIGANENQKRTGDVQKERRVRTFSTFGFRRAGVL